MTRPKTLTFAAAATVLLLAGCGGGDDTDGTNSASNGDTGGGTSALVAPTSAEEAMDGEDGWTDLLPVDLPAPGTAEVTINGTSYDVDITCTGPGVIPDPETAAYLFRVGVTGDFVTDDGRNAGIILGRHVDKFENWSATGGAGDVYDYPGQDVGQVQTTVEAGDLTHSAVRVTPADDDRTGEAAPLLHVSPDGGFTVETELEKMWGHDDALEGSVTIAGQCSAPWADLS